MAMLVSMLQVCYSSRGTILAHDSVWQDSVWHDSVWQDSVWQDHFGDWLTVFTGHILPCVRHPTSGCDLYNCAHVQL